ncbi:MAG: dihydrofolate synthase/folylpolyglutamate synthase [Pirellulaceae bacterium]|jgi:dihydrofolate synthase/folylpolyglutamate synthase
MPTGTKITDRQSAIEFLLGRINYERASKIPYRSSEFGLDRMRQLLAMLGDPHLRLPAIHVAGTKGKGSCSTMISAALTACGKRVGLYISPHLEMLEERFNIDGQNCTADDLVELMQTVQPVVEKMESDGRRPTFFEVTTALAFLYFSQQKVDLAVLEVGLGGRLDSTNVCQPIVTVITSISFDHMRELGDTLPEIATEKAGTIKPGVPVVTGVTEPESLAAIERIALQHKAPVLKMGVDFGYEYLGATLDGNGLSAEFNYWERAGGAIGSLENIQFGMAGQHQASNAAVAIQVMSQLRTLGQPVELAEIRKGLAQARCAARIEVAKEQPLVILDSAHNLASVRALVNVIQEALPGREGILVFAANRDKDVFSMVRELLPAFSKCVVTTFDNSPRAMSVEQLVENVAAIQTELAGRAAAVYTADNASAAWEKARQLASGDAFICVTGSFFLAAEIRAIVRETLTPE